jgi:hypothetical protein
MKDPIDPSNLIVKPAEDLESAPFNAPELIKEVVSSPEPPLELSSVADPWTLPATTGVPEEIAPAGAVEVGGAGTGAWVTISTFAAANPIVSVAAVAGVILLVATIIGAFWWGNTTPQNTPATQTDAQGNTVPNPRLDIVNNPLPDNPQPFIDATKASPPVSSTVAPVKSVPGGSHATTKPTAPKTSGSRSSGRQSAAPASGPCGPGYHMNPRFLAGEPWTPGQSVCMRNN